MQHKPTRADNSRSLVEHIFCVPRFCPCRENQCLTRHGLLPENVVAVVHATVEDDTKKLQLVDLLDHQPIELHAGDWPLVAVAGNGQSFGLGGFELDSPSSYRRCKGRDAGLKSLTLPSRIYDRRET